jgi:mannose-6-phosphate isomerase-like protein (cupin superfamily)
MNERYMFVQGTAVVKAGDQVPEPVEAVNVVVIPAGTPQQITNDGDSELIFYCMCTPRFTPDCYEALE